MSGTSIAASNVTSTRPDGAYNAGDVIDIVVTLSTAMRWTKIVPTIVMLTAGAGTACGRAKFVDGNGTATWRFEYVVPAGVTITDLATMSSMPTFGSALPYTRVSDSLACAGITLPSNGAAGSLNANKAITASTPATPTIEATSIEIDLAAGTYPQRTEAALTVTFPEAVDFIAPATYGFSASDLFIQLTSSTGTGGMGLYYIGGAGTNVWRFGGELNVASVSGIRATAISIGNGVGFKRADGTPIATPTIPLHGSAGAFSTSKTINTSATALTSASVTLTGPATATFQAGDVLSFTATWATAATLSGGTPTIQFMAGIFGEQVGEAVYTGGSGTTTWTFEFTVPEGFVMPALCAIRMLKNGATITVSGSAIYLGSFGSNLSLSTHPVLSATTLAESTNVGTALADGAYDAGTDIDIDVTWPFAITATGGTPSLALHEEDGTALGKSAALVSGSGTDTWTFRYTAEAAVVAARLRTGALALNGATLTKTTGGYAVAADAHDPGINSLVWDHAIELTGIGADVGGGGGGAVRRRPSGLGLGLGLG